MHVLVKWMVHPQLAGHESDLRRRGAGFDEIRKDPVVREGWKAEEVMTTAIAAILKFAGFAVSEGNNEMSGALVVTYPEA